MELLAGYIAPPPNSGSLFVWKERARVLGQASSGHRHHAFSGS